MLQNACRTFERDRAQPVVLAFPVGDVVALDPLQVYDQVVALGGHLAYLLAGHRVTQQRDLRHRDEVSAAAIYGLDMRGARGAASARGSPGTRGARLAPRWRSARPSRRRPAPRGHAWPPYICINGSARSLSFRRLVAALLVHRAVVSRGGGGSAEIRGIKWVWTQNVGVSPLRQRRCI